MVNQSSSFAVDAFGDTIVRCIGCNGWTDNLEEEVCECCGEQGLSRDLIMLEQEFASAVDDDFPMWMEYDDSYESGDYDHCDDGW